MEIRVKGSKSEVKRPAGRGGTAARPILGRRRRIKGRVLPSVPAREELGQKTVAALRDMARAFGVPLGSRRKADIIESIINWVYPPKERPGMKAVQSVMKEPAEAARPIIKDMPPRKERAPAFPSPAEAGVGERPSSEPPAPPVVRAIGRTLMERAKASPLPPPKKAAAPPAHGPDRVVAIAVDPETIFAHWDVARFTAAAGVPVLRVYDVTGVPFPAGKERGHFDISLMGSRGEVSIKVMPGHEYALAVGTISRRGSFKPACLTHKVATPPGAPPKGKAALPEKYFRFEPGEPTSS